MSWFKRAQKVTIYDVQHDCADILFSGSEAECYNYIHKHTSSSVDWAMKYEGWTITRRGDDCQDNYTWYGGE